MKVTYRLNTSECMSSHSSKWREEQSFILIITHLVLEWQPNSLAHTFPEKLPSVRNVSQYSATEIILVSLCFYIQSWCLHMLGVYWYTTWQYQEFITVRVCNSHMVSTPAWEWGFTPTIWIGWGGQSAVNMYISFVWMMLFSSSLAEPDSHMKSGRESGEARCLYS